MKSPYRMLIFIVVLLIVVIWIVLPNPGIHIANVVDKPIDTSLGLDLRGGMRVILQANPTGSTAVTAQQLDDTKQILLNRSNALGVSEVNFTTSGNNRIIGEFPGLTNTGDVVAALKTTGVLAFVYMGNDNVQEGSAVNVDYAHPYVEGQAIPTDVPTLTPGAATATPAATATLSAAAATEAALTTPVPTATPAATGKPYPVLMTGAALSTVGVTRTSLGEYEISFTLNSDATQKFATFTTNHVNEILGIVLDGVLISGPRVNSAIPDGKGVIQGTFTYDSANKLAIQLRYGSLPVALTVVQSEAVGASLGQDSINKSVIAGIIGLSMVIILMIYFYRLPGLLAVAALAVYGLTNFAIFKAWPVTLTLPGIAGFVLSIGMAVDANILIFERLKEELRAGRGLQSAIDLAWRRAWPSIRDSNISTLITCGILVFFGIQFGAALVTGFAINLAIGVLVSLFTAIIVTRTFLHVVLDSLKFTEHPRWFGV